MADVEELEEIALASPKKASAEAAPEECAPCKGGAPAWMATFADMATLLMAFFVLILSFAHVNVPKFKNVSGSMQMAFGVQSLIPVIEPPDARNLIATQYMSAQVESTPMTTIEEQRTDEPPPESPELNTDVGAGDSSTNDAVELLQSALAEQIALGKISISVVEQTVTVNLLEPNTLEADNSNADEQGAGQLSADLIEIFAAVAEVSQETSSNIEVYSSSSVNEDESGSIATQDAQSGSASALNDQYELIRANLADEISKGLANVSRSGDDIIIRLAEQGTFASGDAELQSAFLPLLDNVGATLAEAKGVVSIEGHTDSIPIGGGGRFRSNWDLSSARAAAVADYLLNRSFLEAGQLTVSGFADTLPIASNETATGRAENRRIEIIISGN
jgi:chemotaxis protein MotB